MIKTIIVDDDVEMLTGLENIISWKEHGFEFIGKAVNGKKALELVEKLKPDLLITDITMPSMDGMTLIKKAKNIKQDLKAVILTCHEDFDYAKEALKLRADDYLVKYSLSAEDLIQVLDNIKSKIKIEESKKNTLARIESNLNKNRQVLLQKFFTDIIENKYISREDIYQRAKHLGINLPQGEFRLAGLFIDDYPLALLKAKINEENLIKYSIQNMVKDILDSKDSILFFWYERTAIIIIENSDDNLKKKLINNIKQLQISIDKYLYIDISVCISNLLRDIKNISTAIEELIELRISYFYTGPGSLVRDKKDFKNKIDTKAYLMNINKLKLSLVAGDYENIYKELNNLFNTIAKQQYSPDSVRTFLRRFIIDIESTANHYGISLGEVYLNLDTFEQYRTLICNLIKQFQEKISDTNNNSYRREIMEVMKYINNNIEKGITCEMMADHVNMSSSYFSRLFKNESGVSFSDYLINRRVQMATELLMSTELPVEEISLKVGIDNVSYFYRLYKKITGKTPGDVRQR